MLCCCRPCVQAASHPASQPARVPEGASYAMKAKAKFSSATPLRRKPRCPCSDLHPGAAGGTGGRHILPGTENDGRWKVGMGEEEGRRGLFRERFLEQKCVWNLPLLRTGGTDSQEERVTSLLGRQLCRRNLSIGLLCCPPSSISPSASLPHPRHHPLLPSHGSPPAGCSGAPRVSSMGCWTTTTTRRSWPRAHGNKP